MLKTWFWKPDVQEVSALDVRQKTCQYLYLPRLQDESVFHTTLNAGTGSRDFFGIAYAKEDDKYVGFSFGDAASPVLDSTLLLVEPSAASIYADAQRAATGADQPKVPEPTIQPASGDATPSVAESGESGYGTAESTVRQTTKRQFYAAIELDAIQAKKQFSDLVDEVVLQFTQRPGVQVKIAIEIQAESPTGFDEGLQRAVKENCNVLRFKNAEFEDGE